MDALSQVAFTEKQGSRRKIQNRTLASYGQQSFDVGIEGGGETNRFGVHQLLAGEPGLRQQQPDAGVEPQYRGRQFFQQGYQPVVAMHMQQLVTDDGALGFLAEGQKGLRQENHGRQPSERDRSGS